MKRLFTFILFCSLAQTGFSQSDGNYEYNREFVWGLNKNTRGGLIGGLTFKWSKALGERKLRTIGFELMNVKNPDEIKISTQLGQFIPYKTNYLYAVRIQYGRDHILFKKTPVKGVQINFNYAGGPSIGVIAPYYVTDVEGKRFHFDENSDILPVVSTGYPFQGLSKSEFSVGINAKASLSFEMGIFKNNVTGFEVGTLLDAYTKEINLMTVGDNDDRFFPTLFITFFYGRRR